MRAVVAEPRTFRLTTGRVVRYGMPVIAAVVGLLLATGMTGDLYRSSSPFVYLPLPLVVLFLLWLFWTTPQYGDLTVTSTEIRLRAPLGWVRTVGRDAVTDLVMATLVLPGYSGLYPAGKLLLVGSDGRCRLMVDGDYDIRGLADVLGVPIKQANDQMNTAEVNRLYPGAVPLIFNPSFLLLAAIGFALAVLVLVSLATHKL